MNKVDFPAIKPKDWPPKTSALEPKQPVEIFEEGGIASDWSEAYIDNVELFYGQYLCFLVFSVPVCSVLPAPQRTE